MSNGLGIVTGTVNPFRELINLSVIFLLGIRIRFFFPRKSREIEGARFDLRPIQNHGDAALDLLVFADRVREIRNAVEFCDKQKLKMILAGGQEAYKVKDLLRSKNITVILRPMLSLPVEEDDPYDRLLSQPAELSQSGIKFAIGSFDNVFAR